MVSPFSLHESDKKIIRIGNGADHYFYDRIIQLMDRTPQCIFDWSLLYNLAEC